MWELLPTANLLTPEYYVNDTSVKITRIYCGLFSADGFLSLVSAHPRNCKQNILHLQRGHKLTRYSLSLINTFGREKRNISPLSMYFLLIYTCINLYISHNTGICTWNGFHINNPILFEVALVKCNTPVPLYLIKQPTLNRSLIGSKWVEQLYRIWQIASLINWGMKSWWKFLVSGQLRLTATQSLLNLRRPTNQSLRSPATAGSWSAEMILLTAKISTHSTYGPRLRADFCLFWSLMTNFCCKNRGIRQQRPQAIDSLGLRLMSRIKICQAKAAWGFLPHKLGLIRQRPPPTIG